MGCPIAQLYLTLGQIPARFSMMKIRMSFLKYILDEDDKSLISKVLKLQLENPTRGDWASTCVKDLKQLELSENFQDIKRMKQTTFVKIVNTKIDEIALAYLKNRQGQKGGEIVYSAIELSEYLSPTTDLNISEKRYLFEMKKRMIRITANFPSKQKLERCPCGETENMEHVYTCS